MPIFTAHFDCTFVRAAFDFKAETPEEALDLARAKYNEDYYDLDFQANDADCPPIQEIAIHDADSGPTGVFWQSSDHRLREAAPDLLQALEGALRGLCSPNPHPMAQEARIRKAIAAIAKAKAPIL